MPFSVRLERVWLEKLEDLGEFSGKRWVFAEAPGSSSSHAGRQMAVWDQSFVHGPWWWRQQQFQGGLGIRQKECQKPGSLFDCISSNGSPSQTLISQGGILEMELWWWHFVAQNSPMASQNWWNKLKTLSPGLQGPARYGPRLPPQGFPGDSVVKKPPANAGGAALTPGPGRSPADGNGYPFQYSCLGNPMDRGAWWGHDVAMEEQHSNYFSDLVSDHRHLIRLHSRHMGLCDFWKSTTCSLRVFAFFVPFAWVLLFMSSNGWFSFVLQISVQCHYGISPFESKVFTQPLPHALL